MQEVDNVTNHNGRVDQIQELGGLTGMYQCFGNKTLRFATVHPDHRSEDQRVLQVTDLLQKIAAKNERATIITGDFNAVPGAASIGLMQRNYKRLLTSDSVYSFPSDKPRSCIDYIILSAEHRWKVLRQEVLNEATASDHRPVPGTV